jgi:hypothetical protein
LNPGPIKQQNVQLAQSVFHDSTLNALIYYGNHGHPEFFGTAKFIAQIIRWWKLVNSKTSFLAKKKRDPDREIITP